MYRDMATKTVLRQMLAGATALLASAATLWLLLPLARQWRPASFDPGGAFMFTLFIGVFYGMGLVATVFFATIFHYQRAGSAAGAIRLHLLVALVPGTFITAAVTLEMWRDLGQGWTGQDLYETLATTGFFLGLAVLLGLAAGVAQVLVLTLTGYDPIRQRRAMSNRAAVSACRAQELPYYQYVRIAWQAIAFGLLVLGSLVLMVLWITVNALYNNSEGVALAAGMFVSLLGFFFGLWRVSGLLLILSEPEIASIAGKAEKSIQYRQVKFMLYRDYYVGCQFRFFKSEKRLWNQIRAGQLSRLWYTTSLGEVVAYEALEAALADRGADAGAA